MCAHTSTYNTTQPKLNKYKTLQYNTWHDMHYRVMPSVPSHASWWSLATTKQQYSYHIYIYRNHSSHSDGNCNRKGHCIDIIDKIGTGFPFLNMYIKYEIYSMVSFRHCNKQTTAKHTWNYHTSRSIRLSQAHRTTSWRPQSAVKAAALQARLQALNGIPYTRHTGTPCYTIAICNLYQFIAT